MLGRLLTGVAALGVVALSLGCFSERGGTGPSAGACRATLDPGQFGSVVIAVEGFTFQPATVRVDAGGQVTWVNCEPPGTPQHTSTDDGGAWDSGLLETGDTYSFTFPTAGTFTYHCELHPGMTAQVQVDP